MKRTVAVKDEEAGPSEPDAKRAKTEEDAEADGVLELDINEFECVVCHGEEGCCALVPAPSPQHGSINRHVYGTML